MLGIEEVCTKGSLSRPWHIHLHEPYVARVRQISIERIESLRPALRFRCPLNGNDAENLRRLFRRGPPGRPEVFAEASYRFVGTMRRGCAVFFAVNAPLLVDHPEGPRRASDARLVTETRG
jgi:hypothetical protein